MFATSSTVRRNGNDTTESGDYSNSDDAVWNNAAYAVSTNSDITEIDVKGNRSCMYAFMAVIALGIVIYFVIGYVGLYMLRDIV